MEIVLGGGARILVGADVDGEWDDHDLDRAARLSPVGHRLANAAEDLASDGGWLRRFWLVNARGCDSLCLCRTTQNRFPLISPPHMR